MASSHGHQQHHHPHHHHRPSTTNSSAMAKLVSLYRPQESPLQRCQFPVPVDETVTMVAQFSLSNTPLESLAPKLKELSSFTAKYNLFTDEERPSVFVANETQLYTLISRCVPCVGCRRSIERMYGQLIDLDIPALAPIVIGEEGSVSLPKHFRNDVKLTCALFYKYGTKLNTLVESIPKTKKSRRCLLHSLESQKLRSAGNWLEVWDLMERECKEEVLVIEQETLLDTVETHLTKHRFCSECKTKVLQAFDLLVLNVDPKKEKGFMPSLYDGIRYCSAEKHIHVANGTEFVARLVRRAEPELRGSRREKHAKTIDVAQEEILVCIGICLYERLHRINQRLREESQTWQIMFHLCVECLKTNFEMIVEEKQGFSQLELVCEEITKAELAKEQKREHKKQKRKLRKNKHRAETPNREHESPDEKVDGGTKCPNVRSHCKVCEGHLVRTPSPPSPLLIPRTTTKDTKGRSSQLPTQQRHQPPPSQILGNSLVCSCCCVESGYSSSSAGIDSPWNSPSSCNSSDMTCSDSCCVLEEENHNGISDVEKMSTSGLQVMDSSRKLINHVRKEKKTDKQKVYKVDKQHAKLATSSEMSSSPVVASVSAVRSPVLLNKPVSISSLEDLLRVSHPSEEESYIPPDELRAMRAKVQQTSDERLKFRENLRQRFTDLQKLSKFRFRPFAFKTQPQQPELLQQPQSSKSPLKTMLPSNFI